ncbi:MAG: DUF4231 domain-containing protein [Chitinophagaceae bacterium]|jgi:hypothetical protein|nr:DUF4231 domain-containing protein [Chitinophagaceae bacterium]
MTASEYLDTRVQEQMQWMEQKSARNQQWYKILKLIELVCAAAIPFLAGFYQMFSFFPLLTALMGVIIVICNGLQQLNHFHEKWINYRTAIELMKREKFLFQSGASPYNVEDAFKLFVQNFENLLSNENRTWKMDIMKNPQSETA